MLPMFQFSIHMITLISLGNGVTQTCSSLDCTLSNNIIYQILKFEVGALAYPAQGKHEGERMQKY